MTKNLTQCHAERSSEKSAAILTAKSKHPYPNHTAEVGIPRLRSE